MKPVFHTALMTAALLVTANSHAQPGPHITTQPTNQSVSLGASATFRVAGTTTNPPMTVHWQLASADLALATGSSLTFTNIQITNAGDYTAVLTDGSGSVTSRVAHLEVDTNFTKITTGRIVTDVGSWIGCAWGDYDGDGYLDLIVTYSASSGSGLNALYHNNGNGTFTRITNVLPATTSGYWVCCAWADVDNDGHLDLLLTHGDSVSFLSSISLYHNNGDGTFRLVPPSAFHGPANPISIGPPGAAFADYDRDGFVDLYVKGGGGSADLLLHNIDDGTFTRDLTTIPPDNQFGYGATWADINNDGWPDLFVSDLPTSVYTNNGNGTFTRILSGSLATQSSYGCLWADYNNDGYLDALALSANGVWALFRNNGDGTFQQISNLLGEASTNSVDANWGDYDNDGYVDIFFTGGGNPTGPNYLLHNNGDGTFTRILTGSLATDLGNGTGCVWGDYDNDGFLDLFVARAALNGEANLLYRNNGNTNAWIKVRLTGTASNRSAIGAKVHVKATIRGRSMWQLREIGTGGDGNFSGSLLEAHLGLGDATNIDELRIEWPSGIVQTLSNVAPRQTLQVVEHQTGPVEPLNLTGALMATNRAVALTLTGNKGKVCIFEASTNLIDWVKIGARSNALGSIEFLDTKATNYTHRFYRALVP